MSVDHCVSCEDCLFTNTHTSLSNIHTCCSSPYTCIDRLSALSTRNSLLTYIYNSHPPTQYIHKQCSIHTMFYLHTYNSYISTYTLFLFYLILSPPLSQLNLALWSNIWQREEREEIMRGSERGIKRERVGGMPHDTCHNHQLHHHLCSNTIIVIIINRNQTADCKITWEEGNSDWDDGSIESICV